MTTIIPLFTVGHDFSPALRGEGDMDFSLLNHQRISVKLDLVGESWGIQFWKTSRSRRNETGMDQQVSINRAEKTEGPLLARPTVI